MKDVKDVVSMIVINFVALCLEISTYDPFQQVKDKEQTAKPKLHPVSVHSPWHHILV